MGFALVLCFLLAGLWILFELILGRLPAIRGRWARIALVVGVFLLSLFVVGFASIMALGLVRSGVIPASYGQFIAISALVLVLVFPLSTSVIVFDRYRKLDQGQGVGDDTKRAEPPP